MKQKPKKRITELRIDPETATREELIAELHRLDEVCDRWAQGWQTIVHANAEAWENQVRYRDERIAMFEILLEEKLNESR